LHFAQCILHLTLRIPLAPAPSCLHKPIFQPGQVIVLISLPCGLGPISHIYPTDGDMQKI